MRILIWMLFFSSFLSFAQSHRVEEQKGIGIKVGLPQVNTLTLTNDFNKLLTKTGFNGLSLGVFYTYKKNNFFELDLSFCATSRIPVPGPITYIGEYELASALIINLKKTKSTELFSFSYGTSFTHYNYVLGFNDSDTLTNSYKNTTDSQNLGFHFSGALLFRKRFALALNYNPSIIRLNHPKIFNYQHQVGLELIWRFKLKN